MGKVPLVNKPGVTNWVEKHNALPRGSWIRRAAEHLHGKGMPTGRAIATAVNAAKRMCATGDTNWPGSQQVNPGSRAQACMALAAWDAARAKAKAEASIVSDERMVVELSRVELAWNESQHPRHGKGKTGGGRFAPGGSATGTAKSTGAVKQVPTKLQGAQRSQVVRSGRKALKALGQKYAKPRKAAPGKTADHVAAGLHRIGKMGNAYVDRDGKLWHRVGEGKGSRFMPGLPNRPKAKPKGVRGDLQHRAR